MASNRFGNIFTMTTFGESHGPMIGVVIDGCPAGVSLDLEFMQSEMDRRKPGAGNGISPRKEEDQIQIVSGILEGKTTGAPLTILIANKDANQDDYRPIENIYRPGHANFSYMQKYGVFDARGGGRASGRETVARVAAGSVAKQIIAPIETTAYVLEVGGERENIDQLIKRLKEEGDSVGAIIECRIRGVPPGLGDPIYDKLEARLASAMLSIPAVKGFEIGSGFAAAKMRGSEHNDSYSIDDEGNIAIDSNHHGGILGGISTGKEIVFRVAFKPTSSIKKPQKSVTYENKEAILNLPQGGRHDVCIGLRAPPIIEAMAAITICDFLLINRCSKISY